jgi:hypothetical protein
MLTGCRRKQCRPDKPLMAASFPRAIIVIAAMVIAIVGTLPAAAQFGSIFGDPPPRPPRNVPTREAPPPDLRPDDPLPPPMNLPPSRRPGGSGIESQSLPPPGSAAAPPVTPQGTAPPFQPSQRAPQQTVPAQQQAAPTPTAPGLPPGQRQPRGTPQQANTPQQNVPQQANVDPQPSDEVVLEPSEQKIVNPTAVFSGLDKITGRTISFDVAINETVQFGALQVTPRACYSRPPTETSRTDAFVSVDEVTLQGDVRRIFTGWMFASSPGLNAVEHPIYDIWLSDCKGGQQAVAEAPEPQRQQPQQRQQQRQQQQRQPAQQQQQRLAPPLQPSFR